MFRRIRQIADFMKSATAEFIKLATNPAGLIKSAISQLDSTQLEYEADAKN